jgi:hypothetical protein
MKKVILFAIAIALIVSCKKEDTTTLSGKDINTATKVSVDRFSSTAGHLQVRTGSNGLPAANAPVNFDVAPFITQGLDKNGNPVKYYNFDVQSTTPEDIYVFFKTGATTPVEGQNNIIPTLPGEPGYNDFWLLNKVIVPDNYVPNSLTSEAEVLSSGYMVTKTRIVVNCPVVPFGSTAARSKTAGTASTLVLGWYKNKAVAYFTFDEAAFELTSAGFVPTSDIFVMFNDNVTGPASGFKVETGTTQTHNVIETLPADALYSPLWDVSVIDNTNFSNVSNLTTAQSFPATPAGATVNCPVVK